MLKKSVTYVNFDGDEVSEDLYFNYSKAELVEMEMSRDGGLKEFLEGIVAAQDGKQIMAEMKKILLGAYGIKSPDGKRFIKNQQLRDEFESSEAYSVVFMELVTETDKAVAFVNGVVPRDLQDQVKAAQTQMEADNANADEPTPENPKKLTPAEVREMDSGELQSGLATGKYVIADATP